MDKKKKKIVIGATSIIGGTLIVGGTTFGAMSEVIFNNKREPVLRSEKFNSNQFNIQSLNTQDALNVINKKWIVEQANIIWSNAPKLVEENINNLQMEIFNNSNIHISFVVNSPDYWGKKIEFDILNFTYNTNDLTLKKNSFDSLELNIKNFTNKEAIKEINKDWIIKNDNVIFNNPIGLKADDITNITINEPTTISLSLTLTIANQSYTFTIENLRFDVQNLELKKYTFTAEELGLGGDTATVKINDIDNQWIFNNIDKMFNNTLGIKLEYISSVLTIINNNSNISLSFAVENRTFRITIIGFLFDTTNVNIVRSNFNAVEFGLNNVVNTDAIPLITNQWILQHVNILLTNNIGLTAADITNTEAVVGDSRSLNVSFIINKKTYNFTINNFAINLNEITLKKDTFTAAELGYENIVSTEMLSIINSNWIWSVRDLILNGASLIGSENFIFISKQQIIDSNNIQVKFQISNKTFIFNITGTINNVTLKQTNFDCSVFGIDPSVNPYTTNLQISVDWIFRNKAKIFNYDSIIDSIADVQLSSSIVNEINETDSKITISVLINAHAFEFNIINIHGGNFRDIILNSPLAQLYGNCAVFQNKQLMNTNEYGMSTFKGSFNNIANFKDASSEAIFQGINKTFGVVLFNETLFPGDINWNGGVSSWKNWELSSSRMYSENNAELYTTFRHSWDEIIGHTPELKPLNSVGLAFKFTPINMKASTNVMKVFEYRMNYSVKLRFKHYQPSNEFVIPIWSNIQFLLCATNDQGNEDQRPGWIYHSVGGESWTRYEKINELRLLPGNNPGGWTIPNFKFISPFKKHKTKK